MNKKCKREFWLLHKQAELLKLWATYQAKLGLNGWEWIIALDTIILDYTQHWSFPSNDLFSFLKPVKFACGFRGRKTTKVELKFLFFHFLWGVPLIWPYKYEGIDSWGQKNCPTLALWTSNTSQSNNKNICRSKWGSWSFGGALREQWSVEWTQDLSVGYVRLTSTQRGFEL